MKELNFAIKIAGAEPERERERERVITVSNLYIGLVEQVKIMACLFFCLN